MNKSFREQLLVAKKQLVKEEKNNKLCNDKKPKKRTEKHNRRYWENLMGINKNTYFRHNGSVRQRG
ncbi:hypothetical protein [Bacillus sp. JJ722]|uniref:hypothetical protein n=1 Tax=Bacillus sp. JJ722 TaxID=3122973 RepID=UPI003000DAB7